MAEASGKPFKYNRSEIRALFGLRPTTFRKLEIKAGIIPAEPGSLPVGQKRCFDEEQMAKLASMLAERLGRYQLSYEPATEIVDLKVERQALCAYFADRQNGAQILFLLARQQPFSTLAEELLRREEPKYSPENRTKEFLSRTIMANNASSRAKKNALLHPTKTAPTGAVAE